MHASQERKSQVQEPKLDTFSSFLLRNVTKMQFCLCLGKIEIKLDLSNSNETKQMTSTFQSAESLTYRELQAKLKKLREKGYNVPKLNSSHKILLNAYQKIQSQGKNEQIRSESPEYYSMMKPKNIAEKIQQFQSWIKSDKKLYSYLIYLNDSALMYAKEQQTMFSTFAYNHPLNLDYNFRLSQLLEIWLQTNPFFSFTTLEYDAIAAYTIRNLV